MSLPIIKLLLFIPLFSVVSCSTSNTAGNEKPMVKTSQEITCPVLKSGKWHAWIDRFQQPEGSYRLNVSGEIQLPNPTYELIWSEGPTDRMTPPSLQLSLKPVQQEGMAIQVISTQTAKHEITTSIPHYRHISVYCEEKLLGKMSDVMLAE
ncbi:hypothetical protein ACXJY6_19195 [Vibrio sp. RC27]